MLNAKKLLTGFAKKYPGFYYAKSGDGYQYGFRKIHRRNRNQKIMHEIGLTIKQLPHIEGRAYSFWWGYVQDKLRTPTPYADRLLTPKKRRTHARQVAKVKLFRFRDL